MPILLAAALTLPALEDEVFDADEASTMTGACWRHLGPCAPAEAVHALAHARDQAWGQAIVLSQWGRLVGWSEFAIRALPWLLGTLALAWLYRLGRDLFSARVALAAAFLLSTSVLFLVYMHVARSFTAVMLLAAMAALGYWRVALRRRPPGRGDGIALVAGTTGLLYSHYFAALLLPALGLFHLLFAGVIGKRRWWTGALLLALALLPGAPQLWSLFSGIRFNLEKESLHEFAMGHSEAMALFLRYLSNGLLVFWHRFVPLLTPAALLLILPLALRRRIRRQLPGPALYLALVAGLHLGLVLGVNEWIKVFEARRIRYLAALWPASMLLISAALQRLSRRFGRLIFPVAVALLALTGARDYLQQGELLRHSWGWRDTPVSIAMMRALDREAGANDFLLVDPRAFRYENRTYGLYTGAWGERRAQLLPDSSPADLAAQTPGHCSVWLLYRNAVRAELRVDDITDRLTQEGRIRRHALYEAEVSLEQFLSPRPGDCAQGPGGSPDDKSG